MSTILIATRSSWTHASVVVGISPSLQHADVERRSAHVHREDVRAARWRPADVEGTGGCRRRPRADEVHDARDAVLRAISTSPSESIISRLPPNPVSARRATSDRRYRSTTGPQYAETSVVEKRSNSRHTGRISCEVGHVRLGQHLAHDLAGATLVVGVGVAVKEADRDGLHAVRPAGAQPPAGPRPRRAAVTTSPSYVLRSLASSRRCRGTSGSYGGTKTLYIDVRMFL